MSTLGITIDPLDKYTHINEQRIEEACGLIPYWMLSCPADVTFKDHLDKCYGFGLYKMEGGKIDDKGVYRYPEDPELYPLMQWERDGEVVYMYEYAIVAFFDKEGNLFVTRMD